MKHKKSFSLPASLSSPSSLARSSTWSHSEAEPFIELLAKSNFSFLQGASHPEEMVLRAKQLDYAGIALVDVNGLYGVVRGFQALEKPSAFDTAALARSQKPFHYSIGSELTPHDASPLALLPMNKNGYARLCRLITQAKRPAPKGFSWLSLEEILKNNEDLICFALPPWKNEELEKIKDAFGDRLYLPVHKDFTWESVALYDQALKIEANLQIPLFATGRPLYHLKERKPLHDVLTCVLHKTTLKDAKTKLLLNSERCLKPINWIRHIWRERPDMLRRTAEIAARLQFSLKEIRYRYPQEVLPPGKTSNEYLRELVEKGLRWRFPKGISEKGRAQIENEMSIITDLEYEDYFLTLWDICQFANSRGILHQGRGSAANSVVCYALGLTNIDPIRMNLLFERFISRERGEPPDIDIDFEHERREEVIQYIYQKYGEHHAAMVCTTICYRSRLAIREVAKVFGLTTDTITQLIRFMGREGLSKLIEEPSAVSKFGLSPRRFQMLIKLSVEMQGFPRHLGIHTGGFVIGHDPIVDLVPVEKATMDGRYVVQWNKDDVNTLGLMKVDVLSLGMLTAIRKCLDLLKEHRGINWNIAQIPAEDKATYMMIQKADTIGVFQIESRAQMSLLPRLKPACYYDLVIEVAIVRPGPIQGGMIHPFLKRRAGKEKITYAHPKLEPILKRTMGVPIFQEQIMQIAVHTAGFTPGEADELRRIMSSSWTKGSLMHTLRQRLINGMLENGISQQYAEQIYKTIVGFSSYGFPESHSASFALITYASCYLKCHHPEIFATALLNSQPMGFYPPRQIISDAQRHGIRFLPLDVQTSNYDYTIEGKDVRVGFRSINNLPTAAVDKLVEARTRGEKFKDLFDFVKRTELPRAVLLRLAAAGAFESLGLKTREALWKIQSLTLDTQSLLFAKPVGVILSSAASNADVDKNTPAVDEMSLIPKETPWESVKREYQTKGFSVDNHPLAVLRPHLQAARPSYTTAKQTETLRHGTRLRMAGLLSLIQKPPTAKGMCFLSVEDETGIFNVLVVPQVYETCRLVLQSSPLIEIDGQLENREGVRHLRARTVRALNLERLPQPLKTF